MSPSQFKTIRKIKMGIPRKRLAEIFGVTEITIYRWENGLTPINPLVIKIMTLVNANKMPSEIYD